MCLPETPQGQWASGAHASATSTPTSRTRRAWPVSPLRRRGVAYAHVGSNPAVHAAPRHPRHRDPPRGDSLSWGSRAQAFTRCDASPGSDRYARSVPTRRRFPSSPTRRMRHPTLRLHLRLRRARGRRPVRPVLFMSYSGTDGLAPTRATRPAPAWASPSPGHDEAGAHRARLVSGSPPSLRAADHAWRRCAARCPMPGGLVIASNQDHARTPLTRHLRLITGKAPTVVLSDDADFLIVSPSLRTPPDKWMITRAYGVEVSDPLGCRCLRDERIHASSSLGDRSYDACASPQTKTTDRVSPPSMPLFDPRWQHGDPKARPRAGPSQARGSQRRRRNEDAMVGRKPRRKRRRPTCGEGPGCRRWSSMASSSTLRCRGGGAEVGSEEGRNTFPASIR